MTKKWSSIIKNELFGYSLEVSHFPESKTTYFLEVEDYEELRGQSFSIVGHKHGTRGNSHDEDSDHLFIKLPDVPGLFKVFSSCDAKIW